MKDNETGAAISPVLSNAGLDARRFPVLRSPKGCTTWVPWSALDAEWAMRIHGQTLERLAERGGLSPDEIFINRHKLRWLDKVRDREAIDLCNELASNVEFSGGAPLHGAASAGTKGYASGDERGD